MELTQTTTSLIAMAAGAGAYLFTRFRRVIVREYEAAVLERRGRVVGLLPTGRSRIWRSGSEVHVFDRREQLMTVPAQEVLTADGIPIKASLLLRWKVTDAVLALTASDDSTAALYAAAQLALRASAAGLDFEVLMADRAQLVSAMSEEVSREAERIGLTVERLALKDLVVSGELKRALSDTARARAESRAQLECTRGDAASLRSLANAARLLETHKGLYALRMLETAKLAAESDKNTLVLGVPEEARGLGHLGE